MEVITHQKLTLAEKKDVLIFLKVSREFFGLYLCLYVTVADLGCFCSRKQFTGLGW